jgi:hypothetical protein
MVLDDLTSSAHLQHLWPPARPTGRAVARRKTAAA